MRRVLLLSAVLAALATPAAAQLIPGWETKQFTLERIDADRVRLMREVEINGIGPNAGQQIFADELEWNIRTGEFTASGNVLLVSPTARLSAERVTFNTRSGTGTFHTASGLASLGAAAATPQMKSMFGTLEPDVYFYGETIDKIGEDRYRINKGGFTTCVQPTPRWEVVSGQATIDLGDYAILRHAIIRVKDVPVFYLPVLYYPIQDDDRATGFLLPTYGSSTYRGQSLSNAFFWAIDRSQDLTAFHDWFTSRGQGAGAEYRYVAAPGSEGRLRTYWLNEKESTINVGGRTSTLPAGRSYEINGTMAHVLPGGLRARASVDYFSDLATQQLYNQNVYDATRRQRSYGGSVTGNWGGLSVTGNYQRSELFLSDEASYIGGYAPSITANLSSKRLGELPIYFAVSSEASKVLSINKTGTVERDFTVSRFDVQPTLRAALTNWPFLAVNTSVTYRNSYFTQSRDDAGVQVPAGIGRQYFDFRADVTGPIFSRVFTPNNALADRLKHVIEPNLSLQRITSFASQDNIPTVGSSYEFIVGGVTRLNYGITNRVLVRKAPSDPAAAQAASAPRELLSVQLSQSYYTDPLASQFDASYWATLGVRAPSNFSPVALTVRANPTALTNATFRLEYDTLTGTLQSVSTTGTSNYRAAQISTGWSGRRSATTGLDNIFNVASTFNLLEGKTGGTYAMNWDITRGYIIQQRWVGFYNAQCCGIAVEYQEFNFGAAALPIPRDRRFNLSFTLAGIGTFSNFFGAFGGGRY